MTTWRDYHTNPTENDMPPPVGAPENMPTNQVNNTQREMMSVIRQLGDEAEGEFDALGTMSTQNADAVAITGGTVNAAHAGAGTGLTDLQAQNLAGGPIPKTVFPADATPLDVKVARATVADTVGPAGSLQLLPIGTVIMWFGAQANIPAGWAICDGTNGTPALVGRYPLGAGPGVANGQQGGQWNAAVATDAQGAHSHGGGTAGTALGVEHMPSHVHSLESGYISGAGQAGAGRIWNGTENFMTTVPWARANPTGGNQAHAHGIGADGNHAHNINVPLAVPYTALFFIMRVS